MPVVKFQQGMLHTENAQFIKSSLLILEEEQVVDKNYCNIIRNEIDVFKILFKEWVATFTKDEFEDEWGLFI